MGLGGNFFKRSTTNIFETLKFKISFSFFLFFFFSFLLFSSFSGDGLMKMMKNKTNAFELFEKRGSLDKNK